LFYHSLNNDIQSTYRSGGASKSALTPLAESDNLWHHCAATWDSSGNVSLYLDGILKDSDAITNVFVGSVTAAAIGSTTVANNFWKGNIDELSLFNKELDSTEVSTLYNDGLPFNPKPLANMIGYWKMGDGGIVGDPIATFPTIVDETGNNNGTMTNMTSTDFVADVPE
jgi:hypothetical protein